MSQTPAKSILRRLEPPLITVLVVALALLIWRPWQRPAINGVLENLPGVNAGNTAANTDGRKADDGRPGDGVATKDDGKDGGRQAADYGSFHQGVKPDQWATTDSKGRLTGFSDFTRPTDPEGKYDGTTISGRTHNSMGEWLPGCRITVTFYLLQPGQPQRSQVYRDGHSDSAGKYRIGARYPIIEGARLFITVAAELDGYAASEPQGLTPAPNLSDILLQLSRPCRVQGVVLDDEGKPVPDARVYFESEHVPRKGWPEKLVEPGLGTRRETHSNAQGVFDLDVAENFYSLFAARDGYAADGGNVGITAKAGETMGLSRSLVLRKVAELRLRVANLADKMPDLVQIEAKFFDAEGKAAGTQLLQGQGDKFAGNLPSVLPGIYKLELWEFRGKRLLVIAQIEIKPRAMTDLGDIRIDPEK